MTARLMHMETAEGLQGQAKEVAPSVRKAADAAGVADCIRR